jgi:hypothetical protein
MKTKKLLTFSFLLMFTIYAKAQSYMWAKHVQQYLYATNQVKGTVIDASNNIYIAGLFNDTIDFDPGPATNNIVGNFSYYILKLDPNGNFVWVKTFDVNAQSGLLGGLDIDAAGNIYASGQFYQVCDFDPGAGTANMTPSFYDTFILKLDPSGNYIWAKQIAGPGFGDAFAYTLCVDATGNVYAGGQINGIYDFDPNAGIVNLGTPGNNHGWLLKWDTNGNYVWAKEITSDNYITFWSMDVTPSGDIYAGGDFDGNVDMDPGAGSFNFADITLDVFIAKYNSSGDFQWAKNYDGVITSVIPVSLVANSNGDVIATGTFEGIVDFDPNAGTTNLTAGQYDSYVMKWTGAGNLDWAVNFGTTGDDNARDVWVDGNNNVYTTGYNDMGNVDFDPGAGTQILNSPYGAGYISALDANGNYKWAAQNGGSSGVANCWKIRTDNANNIISVGNFNITVDFDPGPGVANLNNLAGSGPGQVYVQKLGALTAGVEEVNGNYILKIFPNPTADMIHIKCKNITSTLQIVDINGELIITKKINTLDENNIEIDVTSLSSGIYFVYLNGATTKFIKN